MQKGTHMNIEILKKRKQMICLKKKSNLKFFILFFRGHLFREL